MFKRRFVDADTADWQMDGFEWLIEHCPVGLAFSGRELWRPIGDHFPAGDGDLATRLFDHVKRQYGFTRHDVFELVPVEVMGGPLGGLAHIQTRGDTACGTYQTEIDDQDRITKEIIHYRADMSTLELVATFAHELAHAVHIRTIDAGDIFDELYELFTDLTAVYFGYGLFLANTRFEMRSFSDGTLQGWQAKGAGYLPEADLIFATAMFMRINSIEINTALPHLKPRLHKKLKQAFRQLEAHKDRLDMLRAKRPILQNA